MDLSLNETQQLIRDAATEVVRKDFARDALLQFDDSERGITPELWQRTAELGWMGMLIPEDYAGYGNSHTDVAVLFEALGRGPVPGPYFSSGVLAALLLLEGATQAQKREWLPRVATGEEILAPAITEADFGWKPNNISARARKTPDGWILDGIKLFVPDALIATHLIAVVREDDDAISLMRVPTDLTGISIRPLEGFIASSAEVRFEQVKVGDDALIGGEPGVGWGTLERAMQRAIPIICAYKVGGCAAVFDLSVEYSRERQQFGQPIGRFQRVQDHIIHIVNYLDAARWTTCEALWKLDEGRDVGASIHLAKAVASESYLRACDYAHEVHAGMGVMREYGLTLHTKMSRSLYHLLGNPKHHRRGIAAALEL